ncbi:MAG: glutaredoxin domain-containing protein [bacterium]|nr:glutaredoxin domain-containing protein [bacterium]
MTNMTTQPKITIYTTPTCHFCHAAKDFFTANNVKFTDYNVATDLAKRKEMIERSGQMGVPVIYIGDEMIVGFDEVQLRELLKI